MNPEYSLSKAVSEYLKLQFPKVEFHVDMAGLGLSVAQAGMNKVLQKRRGFADLQIMEPRGKYHGAFIELKVDSPFKADGSLKAAKRTIKKKGIIVDQYDHLQEQQTFIDLMRERGYFATFCVGFDECRSTLDTYLKL